MDFALAADFDQNISIGGQSKGVDPRDSAVHPLAGEAITNILKAGKDFVVISSRGARDVARILNIDDNNTPGSLNIVGSLGWETLRRGTSQLHPQFNEYKVQITGILGEIRERFIKEQLGKEDTSIPDEPNLEFDIPNGGGKVILQRKGFNTDYPEGINLTWNLNQVPVERQTEIITALETYYNEAFAKLARGVDAETLKKLCGPMHRQDIARGFYDLEFRPTSQAAKAEAIIQLMRKANDPKRLPHFRHMPSHKIWIYSGDHAVQDGPVMRAGKIAQTVTRGQGTVIGIWSKMHDEKYKPIRGADATVDGVERNVMLLKDIARLVTTHTAAKAA